MPGLSFAAAMIYILHDHAESAGEYKGGSQREEPFTHLAVEISLSRPMQEDEAANDRRDSDQRESETQETVRRAHMRSLPSIAASGLCSTKPLATMSYLLIIAHPKRHRGVCGR